MSNHILTAVNIFWFRRDLRLDDNAGLSKALSLDLPVLPIFILDTDILKELPTDDSRVAFIHNQLVKINQALSAHHSSLFIFNGTVLGAFVSLISKYEVKCVICNHDYEPYARERDHQISRWLKLRGIPMKTYKDQVIFEKDDILKDDGHPYTIFTPYMKKWKQKFSSENLIPRPSNTSKFLKREFTPVQSLESIGFKSTTRNLPDNKLPNSELLHNYQNHRDFPAKNGTSRMSVNLRFGTLSIRKLVDLARSHSETWLNELIWREFHMMILWHFPYVVDRCFKPQYDLIPWRNNSQEFERWCQGRTGYPMVDAGMRELNNTGYMHNRLRMITASFLSKHLLINWQWGEAYFAEKLLDFELSSNNGGWQWAAGCGCDAAPYFRVFNPYLQQEKFDPQQRYIRKWVEDIDTASYPGPIVDHKLARKRAIDTYKSVLQNF